MVFSDTLLDFFQTKRFKMMIGISKLPIADCPLNIRIRLEVCIGVKTIYQHFFFLFVFPKTEYHSIFPSFELYTKFIPVYRITCPVRLTTTRISSALISALPKSYSNPINPFLGTPWLSKPGR